MHRATIIALLLSATLFPACRSAAPPPSSADPDGDGYTGPDDCDETDSDINAGAYDDTCDGVDNDCDVLIDEEATGSQTYYRDVDLDGYGDSSDTQTGCSAPAGYVADGTDCDDDDGDINPDAEETCAATDRNCDGDPTAGAIDPSDWYQDLDSDGYGDALSPISACDAPVGYVDNPDDCDDLRGEIHPGATEVCSAEGSPTDEDCDGLIDDADSTLDLSTASPWYLDADTGGGDGYGDPSASTWACLQPAGYVDNDWDCGPTDPEVYRGAAEVCDNKENDCDGLKDDADPDVDLSTGSTWYEDADPDGPDGFGDPYSYVDACAQPEGYVDNDKDCVPTDSEIYPFAEEICDDGDDNDCDKVYNEGCWSIDDATPIFAAMGDVDGDGMYDAIHKVAVTDCVAAPDAVCPTEAWVVMRSDGTSFGDREVWLTDVDGSLAFEDSIIGNNTMGASSSMEAEEDQVYDHAWAGDLDGDGQDDLIWLTIEPASGGDTWRWQAALSDGTAWIRFSDALYTLNAPPISDPDHTRFLVGDVTGDKQVDLVGYYETTETRTDWAGSFSACGVLDTATESEVAWVAPGSIGMLVTGTDSVWMRTWSDNSDQILLGDLDGDGAKDYIAFVSSEGEDTANDGTWYAATSNALSGGAAFCDYSKRLGDTPWGETDCSDGCGDWADMVFTADVDGDINDDAIGYYVDDDGDLTTHTSDGKTTEATDDGDGLSNGTFYVGISDKTGYGDDYEAQRLMPWDAGFGVDAYWDMRAGGISRIFLRDVNGDRLPDAVIYDATGDVWEVALNATCTDGTDNCAKGHTLVETGSPW